MDRRKGGEKKERDGRERRGRGPKMKDTNEIKIVREMRVRKKMNPSIHS